MQWVKASERLPKKNEDVYIRFLDKKKGIKDSGHWDGEIFWSHHYDYLNSFEGEELKMVDWLDESFDLSSQHEEEIDKWKSTAEGNEIIAIVRGNAINDLQTIIEGKDAQIKSLTEQHENVFKALEALFNLKQHKDQYGKTFYYEQQQPKAWSDAREALITKTK